MKKLIKSLQPAVYEYSCDGCGKDLKTDIDIGGHIQPTFDTGLHIVGDFGISACDLNGVIFDVLFCSECGAKIMNKINMMFPDAITSGKGIEWEDD